MEPISLVITGDFVPHGRVLDMIKNKEYDNIFNDITPQLKQTDYNIINLECPLVESAMPIDKIGPHLKAPINSIEVLKNENFNVVTLANNHILDFGFEGLKSTIDVCSNNGIYTVSAGLTKEEVIKPLIIEKRSTKIAIINVAEPEFSVLQELEYGANPLDIATVFKAISEVRNVVDFIIIIPHGGHEFYQYPSPEMVKRYKLLIDFGADLVIGHHPHCYSGYEEYKGKKIFYSLGNFCFDWPDIKLNSWSEGFAVKLFVSKNKLIDFELIPFITGRKKPGLKLLTQKEKQDFDTKLYEINKVIASEKLIKEEWTKYTEEVTSKYKTLIQPTGRLVKALQSRKMVPNFFFRNERNKLTLLNLIRCDAHREMLINILNRRDS